MITNEIYTGTVRRVDFCNRVTIPKDICEKVGIKENDPFEVYYTKEGDIILRPYDAYRLERTNLRQADNVIQSINNKIHIIIFNGNEIIYASEHRNGAPLNNSTIAEIMCEERINSEKLEKEIKRTLPHASISIDDEKGMAIVIVDSMGEKADEIIFNYLWKYIMYKKLTNNYLWDNH